MKGEKGQIHMADFALFSWIEKCWCMVLVVQEFAGANSCKGKMLILPFFMDRKMLMHQRKGGII